MNIASTNTNPGHAPSWYAASANDRRLRPILQGETTADVCIIGAGFTGISAALELGERGFSVVVLEGERIGFGASGRNGGQIVNGYSRDLETIGRRYGPEKAAKLAAMSLECGEICHQLRSGRRRVFRCFHRQAGSRDGEPPRILAGARPCGA
jgi:gamma-glutamylputrescine oxidase